MGFVVVAAIIAYLIAGIALLMSAEWMWALVIVTIIGPFIVIGLMLLTCRCDTNAAEKLRRLIRNMSN